MTASGTRRAGSLRSRARGFILAYLMFALVLAGIVTVGLSQIRSRDVQAEMLATNVERIATAITTIRGQVILCAATYAVGATVNVLGGGTVTTEFPVLSADGNGTGLLAKENGLVSDMQCPGRPGVNKSVWRGSDGVFFPPAVPGFGDWVYSVVSDTATGRVTQIYITLSSTSGERGNAVLRRVKQRMLERSGSLGTTVTLENSDGTIKVVLMSA
jgi:hypothetical protein